MARTRERTGRWRALALEAATYALAGAVGGAALAAVAAAVAVAAGLSVGFGLWAAKTGLFALGWVALAAGVLL
ncbi:MAG: hypothetical protein ABEJ04_04390, partial [Halobacteriaceae archaeon]